MLLALVAARAMAAEIQWIDVPFTPPESVPLLRKAEVRVVEAKAEGDDCVEAARRALVQAAGDGQVVRVALAPDDLKPATQLQCRQRRAGEEITASLVGVNAVVVWPGPPGSVYPPVSADRAVTVATLMTAMGADTHLTGIDSLDGEAWAGVGLVHVEVLDSVRYSAEERATLVFQEHVRPWVMRWTQLLEGMPEVQGAAFEVLAVSQDPNKGRRGRHEGLYRFRVPTPAARDFERGQTLIEDLAAQVRAEHAQDARRRDFQPVALAMGGTEPVRRPALAPTDASLPEE